MILDNILTVFIDFAIVLILYLVITHCVNEYRWHKLKRHVIEAIETFKLWDVVNRKIPVNANVFQSITTFLDNHKYKHCFYEHAGTFKLYHMLAEIRTEHERS